MMLPRKWVPLKNNKIGLLSITFNNGDFCSYGIKNLASIIEYSNYRKHEERTMKTDLDPLNQARSVFWWNKCGVYCAHRKLQFQFARVFLLFHRWRHKGTIGLRIWIKLIIDTGNKQQWNGAHINKHVKEKRLQDIFQFSSNMTNDSAHERQLHEDHVPPYAVLFIFTACCIGGMYVQRWLTLG